MERGPSFRDSRQLRENAVDGRLLALEESARQADRDRGVLASIDSSVTALTNAHDDMRSETRNELRAVNRKMASLTTATQRATAAPLALVTFLLSNQLGASPTAVTTATLVTVVLALLYPEALAKRARAVEAALNKGNGSHPSSPPSNPPH